MSIYNNETDGSLNEIGRPIASEVAKLIQELFEKHCTNGNVSPRELALLLFEEVAGGKCVYAIKKRKKD